MNGYLFGHLMELIVTNASRYEIWIVLVTLLPGVLVWLHQQYRNRKREKPERE